MADLRISELTALAGANLASGDLLPIVDVSASETKKITVTDMVGNATTLIADATIPSAKILFGAGSIVAASLATDAVTTAKIQNDAVTAAKLADESTVDLVTTLPASGAFTGQIALDTDDDNAYIWDGSAWVSFKAAGSVGSVVGSTAGTINIVVSTSGNQVTISATLDNTSAAGQFLAGPSASAGAVSYRTIAGGDLPAPTTSARGGVAINGEGLRMDGAVLEIDNDVAANVTYGLVTYNAKGLVTNGRTIISSDLPAATSSAKGAVIPGTGLSVDGSGNLNHTNSATAGTYTKVTVDSQGHVSSGATLADTDLPNHSAALLTSGTLDVARLGANTVPGSKLANYAVSKIGETQPTADHIGQFFFNPLSRDLFLWDGNVFQPIGISVGEIVFAGTFDASAGGGTGLVASVTAEGTAVGLVVGNPLPAAATANNRYYLVVSEAGTITSGNAPNVALSPPDIVLSNGSAWTEIDVSQTVTAQVASNVSFTPAGGISATNVQTAIEEVDSEKLGAGGGTITGELLIGTTGSLAFEGSSANDYETYLAVVDPTADRTITFPDVTGTVITTGDSGTVTSAMIADGTIVNADISASAEIAVSKLADGTARQLLQTDAAGTGVEWTSNVDIPGTLDVTGATTLDGALTVAGTATFNGSIVLEGTTADDYELTLACEPTADRTVTLPDGTTTLAGLSLAQSFTAQQRGAISALTDGATITPDFSLANNFSVTLGGNRTLANPTNLTAGASGAIFISQDGTGSRTLAFGSYWSFSGGTAPTLSTAASAIDVLVYTVRSSTDIAATLITNIS
jgi:hypothetical protein